MSCSIQCTNTCAGTGVYMIGRAYVCVSVCVCSYVGVFLMDNVCLSLHSPATVHSDALVAEPMAIPSSRPNPNPYPSAGPGVAVGSVLVQELLLLSLWRLNVCKIASVFVVLPTYTCKSLILPCTSVCLSVSLSLSLCICACVCVCLRLSAYIHYTCMRIRRKYWGFT